MKKQLTTNDSNQLLKILKLRFEKNMHRHNSIEWNSVQKRLEKNPEKLWSIQQMEQTGGEPDVVDFDSKTNEYLFFDCSTESPNGRRSYCYDFEAQESRKKFKPENNTIDVVKAMGIELLTETQYRALQEQSRLEQLLRAGTRSDPLDARQELVDALSREVLVDGDLHGRSPRAGGSTGSPWRGDASAAPSRRSRSTSNSCESSTSTTPTVIHTSAALKVGNRGRSM